MRKLTIITLLFVLTNQLQAQLTDFLVQVAAYDRPVDKDYFGDLEGVFHVKDHNDIHRYYLGSFSTKEAAEQKASSVRQLGYNAYVIDMGGMRAYCSTQCGAPTIDPLSIRPIFFDFDRSFLRAKSKQELDRLYQLLVNQPSYTAELMAHTDAKGSVEYNTRLSMRRAQAAKDYLVGRGISASRLKTSNFGENTPIAINETATGGDSPQGRQLNRRVELIVRDASGKALNVVEEIEVPDSLQTN